MITLEVGREDDGLRLDRFLALRVPDRSRAQIQKHIEAGAVTVGGEVPKRGAKTPVHAGEAVRYRPPPPSPVEDLVAEEIPISVLWEDEHLLVVDKPRGLVVHPALGHARGTLVNAVLHHVRSLAAHTGAGHESGVSAAGAAFADRVRPGIVHRLDRDTTGAIVIAKNEQAHDALGRAFRERRVEKRYVAVTIGVPKMKSGTIDTKYGRDPRERKKFSSKVTDGKRAITHYTVSEVFPGAALLDVRLETGRTHQIRVHFADLGHPLVGDRVYGRRGTVKHPRTGAVIAELDRPALHAHRLAFPHPVSGERIDIVAPIPDDLSRLIATLGKVAP